MTSRKNSIETLTGFIEEEARKEAAALVEAAKESQTQALENATIRLKERLEQEERKLRQHSEEKLHAESVQLAAHLRKTKTLFIQDEINGLFAGAHEADEVNVFFYLQMLSFYPNKKGGRNKPAPPKLLFRIS